MLYLAPFKSLVLPQRCLETKNDLGCEWNVLSFYCKCSDSCLGNVRHQQVAAGVWQTASCCRRSLLVIATDAAQQTEDVEGQDQDNHAENCHTADPPVARTHTPNTHIYIHVHLMNCVHFLRDQGEKTFTFKKLVFVNNFITESCVPASWCMWVQHPQIYPQICKTQCLPATT